MSLKTALRWQKKNPKKAAANNAAYRKRHPEKANRASDAWKNRNPERVRLTHVKRKFGLTEEAYIMLLSAQSNSCAICNEKFTKTPHVDHNHNTNVVRGLLCDLCNRGLGFFREEVLRLLAAAEYLKSHG